MDKIFKIVIITALVLSGCAYSSGPNLAEHDQTKPYLGTSVRIHFLYDPKTDISQVIKRCWEKMDLIQENMNAYSGAGDVALVNRSGTVGAAVSDDTYRIIEDSIRLSGLTGGAFDITVLPLGELWKKSEKIGRIPSEQELKSACNRAGYQKIRLEKPGRVILSGEGMKIDLGGIAAGYACDEIAGILKAGGINDFLIDAGGEICCNGKGRFGKPWSIGVRDPFDKDRIVHTISLKNECVSTSGNYEKYYVIGNERFSRIIDPRTGYPEKGEICVTVIAPSGAEADVLSTALCVIGGKDGIKLASSLKDVEAMIIEKKDGDTVKYHTGRFH